MIPALATLSGSPWDVLPPGLHNATLDEVEQRFASNERRRQLFEGFVVALMNLAAAGCGKIFLDGSFVTAKPIPDDYDAAWDLAGVDLDALDPVFKDFSNGRASQKAKYGGEFFPSSFANQPGQSLLDFFQVDRFTGLPKGILLILLTNDPFIRRRAP